ncbi:MAG: choice-of-anchor D domain-containing protein [Myxococcota bacterium]
MAPSKLFALLLCGLFASGCGEDVALQSFGPLVRVEPSFVDGGRIVLGERRSLTLVLRNEGGATADLFGPLAASEFDPEVVEMESVRAELLPGDVLGLTLSLSPQRLGRSNSTVVFRIGRGRDQREIAVPITVEGIERPLSLSPSDIDFGPVLVGTVKRRRFELRNDGASPQTLTLSRREGLDFCGPGQLFPFCLVPPDPDFVRRKSLTLPPRSKLSLEMLYAPQPGDLGEAVRLEFQACDEGCRYRLGARGEAVDSALSCTPTSLSFGAVNPGACLVEPLHCAAASQRPVTLLGLARVESERFQIPEREPRILSPNDGGTSFNVEFCPEDFSDQKAIVRVEYALPGGEPQFLEVPLEGRGGGANISLDPPALNFGPVALGVSTRRTLRIRNEGVDDLFTAELQIKGPGFFVIDDGARRVPPGEATTINVELIPDQTGRLDGTIRIPSNERDEPERLVVLRAEAEVLPPCLLAEPGGLDFGDVLLERVGVLELRVENLGTNPCLLTPLEFEGSGFELAPGTPEGLRVPPHEGVVLGLRFRPREEGPSAGALIVAVSDSQRPERRISLQGRGTTSSAHHGPSVLDFGKSRTICGRVKQTLRVHFGGDDSDVALNTTQIVSAAAVGRSFDLEVPELPLEMEEFGSVDLQLGFDPPGEGRFAGRLELEFEDELDRPGQRRRLVVPLRGERLPEGSERVAEVYTPKVDALDLLFVVDDSPWLGPTYMAERAQQWLEGFDDSGIDYRIAVTNNERGLTDGPFRAVSATSNTRILDPSYEGDQVDALQDMLENRGDGGSERVFGALYGGLSGPLRFQQNAGFRRPGVPLLVVLMTDENEQSPGTIRFYQDLLRWEAGGANLLSVVGFSGQRFGTSAASPAPRIQDLVEALGGLSFTSVGELDSNGVQIGYEEAIRLIMEQLILGRTSFELSTPAEPSSMEVAIDGLVLKSPFVGSGAEWSYDSASNRIRFTPTSAPRVGERLDVDYRPLCPSTR